ncbi:hypothetical protein BLOT_002648 [Blomia tropicalis]|nr:hypothetical protein BLOT_002648 [Blomia tropicalis]
MSMIFFDLICKAADASRIFIVELLVDTSTEFETVCALGDSKLVGSGSKVGDIDFSVSTGISLIVCLLETLLAFVISPDSGFNPFRTFSTASKNVVILNHTKVVLLMF